MITRHARGADLLRHRHTDAYVAVVLTGGYVEAGDGGRWRARPGTVIVHDCYEAHRDHFEDSMTTVLNLPLGTGLAAGAGRIDDVDAVVRLAETDRHAAAELMARCWTAGAEALVDWPDLLAADLRADRAPDLRRWADRHGLNPASVSRGFARAYGVSPKRYRLEARARHAWQALRAGALSLADVAAAHGFADQPHLTRALTALTGTTPGRIRAKSIQA